MEMLTLTSWTCKRSGVRWVRLRGHFDLFTEHGERRVAVDERSHATDFADVDDAAANLLDWSLDRFDCGDLPVAA